MGDWAEAVAIVRSRATEICGVSVEERLVVSLMEAGGDIRIGGTCSVCT